MGCDDDRYCQSQIGDGGVLNFYTSYFTPDKVGDTTSSQEFDVNF
jgi:hypothetical protein